MQYHSINPIPTLTLTERENIIYRALRYDEVSFPVASWGVWKIADK